MNCIKIVILILMLSSINAFSQESLTQKMDAYLSAMNEQDKFQGQVLVVRGDSILYNNAFGWADISAQVRNTTEHAFRIGSIAKVFTAVLIAIEIEAGNLSLDTKVSQFIPDYPNGEVIEVAHLLSHRSGIVNYLPVMGKKMYEENTPMDLIKITWNHEPLFAPGEGWDYSNTNYAILGFMLEQINGKSYAELLKKRIFEPSGMINSGTFETDVQLFAKGHGINQSGTNDLLTPMHESAAYAAGNIITTGADMYAFTGALTGGKLIRKETLQTFVTPIMNNYGLGFQSFHNFNNKFFGHNGGFPGFEANWKYYPDLDMMVMIFSNTFTGPFGQIVGTVAKIIFDQPFEMPVVKRPIDLDVEILQRYTGTYRVTDQMDFEISVVGGKIAFQATGQDQYKMEAFDEHAFFIPGTEVEMHFEKNENGAYRIIWIQNGAKDVFEAK